MAKKKISELPAGSALNGSEIVPIVQTGTTKRVTAQDIANLGNASGVEGSGTINYLSKFTASSTIGNSLVFDNGTSVGIGTPTPSATYKLDIVGSVRATTIVKSGGTSSEYLKADGSVSTLTNPITGTGTTNYLPKFTGTSALGDSSIFDNGNIGIGTNTPATKLQVSGGRTSLFSGDAYSIVLAQTSAQANLVYLGTQSDGTFNISNNAGNPQLTLLQSGNLGLGTTTPQTKLVVNGAGYSFISGFTSANRSVAIGIDSSSEPSIQGTLTDGTARQLSINPAGGNVGIGTASPSNGKLVVKDSGYQYIAEPTDSATYGYLGIGHFTNGTFIGTTAGSNTASDLLRFGTSGTERMRITSGGSLLVNTTTDAGYKLDVNGTARVSGILNAKAGSYINGASNSDWGFSVENTGTTNANGLYVNIGSSSTGIPFRVDKGGSSLFNIANSGAATFSSSVTANGNINITKTAGNPAYIEVAGNGNTPGTTSMLYGQDDANNGYVWNRSNAPIYFGINNSIKMTLKANTLNIASIPTSPVGLSTGDIWSNAGILTIV